MFTKWISPDLRHVTVIALILVQHQDSAWRPAIIFTAVLFAKGRKTLTSRLRAAGIKHCYKAYYLSNDELIPAGGVGLNIFESVLISV